MSRVTQARKARAPSRKARPSLVLVTVYGLEGGRCTVRLDDRSVVAALIARLQEAERRRVDEWVGELPPPSWLRAAGFAVPDGADVTGIEHSGGPIWATPEIIEVTWEAAGAQEAE